jgi:hypothetical protein
MIGHDSAIENILDDHTFPSNVKALSTEHTSTLDTGNKLRHLYLFQSELAGVGLMYQRALQGKEKATDQATVLGICRGR